MLHREVRDRVNPITGVIDEPRVNPLEVNIHFINIPPHIYLN